MNQSLLEPEERVLSTLERDGSRRWLKPRLSRGRFWHARRVVAYLLIILFTALPYITVNGKPAILLNIVRREFTFFGVTFLPTDTVLLTLLMLSILLTIILLTALFGRVWCGWACPQTVYMEYVYRPIERLLDGTIGRGGKTSRFTPGWRRVVRYAIYLAISMYLAHTFLAYFVGVEQLRQWIFQSPLNHPTAFLVMAFTTAMMLFDFSFFREQTCIIACPYGRFQSVLLDRLSLIVSYDRKRGEPRGKKKNNDELVELTVLGDCIDCHMCVQVCPTGIDIRDGLQMECIGCAQCIDACDDVMDRVDRPRGLIRYSTQSAMDGEKRRFIRPRIMIYPVILLVVLTLFGLALASRNEADISLSRGTGRLFVPLDDGRISNSLRLRITNRTDKPKTYHIELVGDHGGEVQSIGFPLTLDPGDAATENVTAIAPYDAFAQGFYDITVRVTANDEVVGDTTYRLIGPAHE